jgi:hypothetical protein
VELQDGTDTINISIDEDRQFVENFIQAVVDLAQESVGTQSKFSAHELLQFAGFRFPAKVFRPSFRKVNSFNFGLQDRKDSDIEELRKPAPRRPDVNMGCHGFTASGRKKFALRRYWKLLNGYGETYYKLLLHKGLNGTPFDAFCRGHELQAQLPKAAHAKNLTRDGLRKRVAEMLLELLSKLKVTQYSRYAESLMPARCFKHWCSPCPVTTGKTCRGSCFTQLEVGGTGRLRQLTERNHRQVVSRSVATSTVKRVA